MQGKAKSPAKFVTIKDNRSLNSDIRHSFDANAPMNHIQGYAVVTSPDATKSNLATKSPPL